MSGRTSATRRPSEPQIITTSVSVWKVAVTSVTRGSIPRASRSSVSSSARWRAPSSFAAKSASSTGVTTGASRRVGTGIAPAAPAAFIAPAVSAQRMRDAQSSAFA